MSQYNVQADYYAHYGMEGFPLETKVIITFELENGKTKMTLQYPEAGDIDPKMRSDMEQGWNQSFEKLEALVSS